MPVDTSAATTATNALQAIPFGSLIGAPLDACIEAQAKAARTSWEFIQKVGLSEDPTTHEKKAVNVSFQYNKNGQMVNLVVPLLTIVPIPFLSINTVSIDFKANISASASTTSSTSTTEDLSAGGSAQGKIGWGPFSVSFEAHANYSSKKDSKASQDSKYSVEYTMDVHVDGGQSDMPAGLATVLNILQSSITDAPAGGALTMQPNAQLTAEKNAKLYLEAQAKDGQGVLMNGAQMQFSISALPAGLTLKPPVVTRGTASDKTPPTAQSILAIADATGVVGFILEVEEIDGATYTPGAFIVTGVVQSTDSGAAKPTALQAKTTARSTAYLPPPAPPVLPNTLTLNGQSTVTLDPAQGAKVELDLRNPKGEPVAGVQVTCVAGDASVCIPKQTTVTTGSTGKVSFDLIQGDHPSPGEETTVRFSAGAASASLRARIAPLPSVASLVASPDPLKDLDANEKPVTVKALDKDGKPLPNEIIGASLDSTSGCSLNSPSATTNANGEAVFSFKRTAGGEGKSYTATFTSGNQSTHVTISCAQ